MDYIFRKIKNSELEACYEIHCKLVENMLSKGIKQWMRPIDKIKLELRQKNGENFGLFDDKNNIMVFLSLVSRSDYHEWSNYFTNNSTIWFNTISVNISNSQKGLGKLAIEMALEYLNNNLIGEVYLDCVKGDGTLIKYYTELGFMQLGEKNVNYKSGNFDVVLMKKKINENK